MRQAHLFTETCVSIGPVSSPAEHCSLPVFRNEKLWKRIPLGHVNRISLNARQLRRLLRQWHERCEGARHYVWLPPASTSSSCPRCRNSGRLSLLGRAGGRARASRDHG